MIELVFALIVTHITIVCVTLYLHRCQSHRGVEFHPVVSHFMRAWIWLTTGMNTKLWVSIHRKHHQSADQPGDPHSPHVHGLKTVMTTGYYLYNKTVQDANFVMKYGKGTPKDWIERRLYTPYTNWGVVLMLLIDLAVFGFWGIAVWLFQMAWIPVVASALINGLGHWCGYRNGTTRDQSRNIFPIGILIAGEELHNNHHLDPADPKFSRKPWEFDIGWMYLNILSAIGLAQIKR
jgi:stearoyl-CoA desaturase (delta-9 desaturase)